MVRLKFVMVSAVLVSLFAGTVKAQSGWYTGETFGRIQKAKLGEKGKLRITLLTLRTYQTGWKDTLVWNGRDWIPGRSRRGSVDLGFGINYFFTDRFSMGVSMPLYGDFWDMEGTASDVYNWSSFANGDLRLDFTYVKPLKSNLNFGSNIFVILPAGEQHSSSPVDTSETWGIRWHGGLFRDFTTQTYDYGMNISLYKSFNEKIEFGGQLGFYNNYQLPFQGAFFDFIQYGGAVSYSFKKSVRPYAEVWSGNFISKDAGTFPVLAILGLELGPFSGFSLKFAGTLPLKERKPGKAVSLGRPWETTNFPYQFYGTLINFNPSFGFDFSLTFTHVFREHATGKIRGVVVDGETDAPIPDAEVDLEGKVVITDGQGEFSFDEVEVGIHGLKVRSMGYQPAEAWVLVREGETAEKKIPLYKFKTEESVLLGKVIDAETNEGIKAEVSFPGSQISPITTGNDGTFKVKTLSGVYTLRAKADGYRTEVMTVYLPGNQSVNLTIPLEKMERVTVATGVGILPLTRIYFDLNDYHIKRMYYPALDIVAEILKQNPEIKLEIQGHCSDEGSKEYNKKLGMKRAEEVKKYLVERHKIDPSRLKTVSYGEEMPVVPNDTPEHRYMNRRVEFKVIR